MGRNMKNLKKQQNLQKIIKTNAEKSEKLTMISRLQQIEQDKGEQNVHVATHVFVVDSVKNQQFHKIDEIKLQRQEIQEEVDGFHNLEIEVEEEEVEQESSSINEYLFIEEKIIKQDIFAYLNDIEEDTISEIEIKIDNSEYSNKKKKTKSKPIGKLIKEMLYFLNTTTSDDEEDDRVIREKFNLPSTNTESSNATDNTTFITANSSNAANASSAGKKNDNFHKISIKSLGGSTTESKPSGDSFESGDDADDGDQVVVEHVEDEDVDDLLGARKPKVDLLVKISSDRKERTFKKLKTNSIVRDLKMIRNKFPPPNRTASEISIPQVKVLSDPIWGVNSTANKKALKNEFQKGAWYTKSSEFRTNNYYIQEVNRAIFGDTTGYPTKDTPEYYQAAQNYALYGKDFYDFPKNLNSVLGIKDTIERVETPTETIFQIGPLNTPPPNITSNENTSTNIAFQAFGQHTAITSGAYYQICNGIHPTMRQATNNAAYGMILGNKVTYLAAASNGAPLVYNQQSSTTTNFITTAPHLGPTQPIIYPNPLVATTTQQYLNTYFKETQFVTGATAQATTVSTATNIYERLVYAQMLQQHIFQSQQHAAAVVAMIQHKPPRMQRPIQHNYNIINVNTMNNNINIVHNTAAMTPNLVAAPNGNPNPVNITTPVMTACGRILITNATTSISSSKTVDDNMPQSNE